MAVAVATGDATPSASDSIPGMTRRSLSLGGGAMGSGGCLMGPGTGGRATAGEAPPAPTASALGPQAGGAVAGAGAGVPAGGVHVPAGGTEPPGVNASGASTAGPGTARN